MSVRLVEGGIAAGFGALDQVVASKVGSAGPFNQKWSLYLELAGVAAGVFGRKVGLSGEVRAPLMYSSLALLGQRGARYAMAGNLFKPGSWSGMGGEGGDGDNVLPMASAGGEGGAPRRVRAMGGYPTYPPTAEAPGIAG